MRIYPYNELSRADLIIDAVYEGAPGGKLSGEALGKLLPVGNQGGFRAAGSRGSDKLVALFTSGDDPDWPDTLDVNTGQFIYYGDNKRPGHTLHDTARGGNALLRLMFERIHSQPAECNKVPPCFVFRKYATPVSARSFQFRGLAAPGFPGMPPTSDLVAVWKTAEGQRFQNYRATFTILDEAVISRAWIDDLMNGEILTENCPITWSDWIERNHYNTLTSESTTDIRSLAAQTPEGSNKQNILRKVWERFKDRPTDFERFAARIFQTHDNRVIIDEITRSSIDGGRDAIGRYMLGLEEDPVYVEFALEAKCYRPGLNGDMPNAVGVRETARLISRIRHRQFGVMVTTSAVARQAYEELRADRHPILILSGNDIVEILIKAGYNTPEVVKQFVEGDFFE